MHNVYQNFYFGDLRLGRFCDLSKAVGKYSNAIYSESMSESILPRVSVDDFVKKCKCAARAETKSGNIKLPTPEE